MAAMEMYFSDLLPWVEYNGQWPQWPSHRVHHFIHDKVVLPVGCSQPMNELGWARAGHSYRA